MTIAAWVLIVLGACWTLLGVAASAFADREISFWSDVFLPAVPGLVAIICGIALLLS
jgi:hypothetical protein